ncbi:DNA-binding FadR family transcriptional regulator [Sphingomonas sp. BE138]|uniref:FadR/GntR family transcriptional regulator n=1 Tax=Sphingomonas sp. BE138 TaxID=2817845 RepID=UPI0028580857|nr:FCD domain-containing protein [Sphingomonas sp. BE138]MDR6788025.1 DNA-binding FadR family transcriptional regulator [Sphingomonas sp. BE138]
MLIASAVRRSVAQTPLATDREQQQIGRREGFAHDSCTCATGDRDAVFAVLGDRRHLRAAGCAPMRTDAHRCRGRRAGDDQAFHLAVLDATRNERLLTLSNSIAAAVEWTTRFSRDQRRQVRDPMPDHHAVFRALVAGDGDAARRAMETLIDNAPTDANTPLRAE